MQVLVPVVYRMLTLKKRQKFIFNVEQGKKVNNVKQKKSPNYKNMEISSACSDGN